MTAVPHPFEFTPAQKKQRAKYDFAVVGVLFVFLVIVAATGADAALLIFEAALGIAVGFTVRRGTRHGWMHYAEKYQPGAIFVFTKSLKLGVLWRAVATWLGGCVVLEFLTSMASSDIATVFEFLVGAFLTISTAHAMGLRFGWKSADSTFPGVPVPMGSGT